MHISHRKSPGLGGFAILDFGFRARARSIQVALNGITDTFAVLGIFASTLNWRESEAFHKVYRAHIGFSRIAATASDA